MVPQRSGKIINICSVFSFLGGRQAPAYAATKHGIAGLTKTYCDELAQHNIQVNGIAPGLLRHRAHRCDPERPGPQPARARSHPDRPLGRAARPDGSGRLPREPRLGLRQRARPLGGRRLPRPLGRGRERHARPVPDRHRRRHPEHEGRRRRRRGTRGRGGPGAAAPDEPAQARRRLPSRRRPLGLARRGEPPGARSASTGDPSEIAAVGLCTIRCCKAFLKADGSLVEPVISWMDDRAYLPYLPDDPALAYATTSSGYLGHRLTGAFRDSAANNILLQWPIDVDAWDWSNDAALFEQFRLRRELLFELQLPGEVIGNVTAAAAAATGHPGRASGRLDRERQGGRGARRRAARRHDGARLARHLHRRDGARPGEPRGTDVVLDELRLHPPPLPLREPRRAPRHVDAQLVPRPARPGARRAGRDARRLAGGADRGRGSERSGRQRRPDDRARLARPHRGTVPQGRDARVRRPPHARPRLPVDRRGDRADDEAQRRCDGRRARDHARGDRDLGRRRLQPALHADLRRRVRAPRDPEQRRGGREPRRRDLRCRGRRDLPRHRDGRSADDERARVVRSRSPPTPRSTSG